MNKNLYQKGQQCSINGKKYEINIYNIVSNCLINKHKFNVQKKNELGSSSNRNDLICLYNNNNIGIEAKIYNSPDWMQCSLKYNSLLKKYEGSKRGKIPILSRMIFNNLIKDLILFDNIIPPFINNNLTYDEWCNIKKETKLFNDIYLDIPSDTIQKLYHSKGCNYIQISNGFGLYHLGNDICNFGVPLFKIEQQLRIRIKVHKTKNKKGFCNLSITAACQPKNIKKLNKSKYSLDNINKLPSNLYFIR